MNQRSVLVTGVSRGLGKAIAAHLSGEGWHVISPTRNELDLAAESSIDAFLTSGIDVDGVVLNAGINEVVGLPQLSDEIWNRTIMTNLSSSVRLLRGLAPKMSQRGFGRIVAVSSVYAQRARRRRLPYSLSKAGAEALVRCLTVEFANEGVLANAVAPGFVDTDLTRQNNSPETLTALIERIPVGRMAKPEEIAEVVGFLLSPSNTYISGHVLVVDGGWSCT